MSLISVLGSIAHTVGKVVGVAASIFKVARPLLDALRGAIPEVDTAVTFLEENVAKGGVEADDFLDRNIRVVEALETVSGRGVVVFAKLNELAVHLRVSSQERTPDTLTEDEAATAVRLFGEIHELLTTWGPELDETVKQLDEVQ